jgi:hypothetical protein
MLETQQWRTRADLASLVFDDYWRMDDIVDSVNQDGR